MPQRQCELSYRWRARMINRDKMQIEPQMDKDEFRMKKEQDGLESWAGPSELGSPPCIPNCEPTTHRAVWRVFLPPPHHLHECRPEPTRVTPNGRGSRLHRALEASPGSRARPRLSGSAARLSQPICEVFRVPTGTNPRTQTAEEREQTSTQGPSTAITSATNLHDAVSVRCDDSCTMRCR